MRDTSLIEIDLSAVDRNIRLLNRLVGEHCSICPIVKADAYGLGAMVIVRRLAGRGCSMVAVYAPAEAEALLKEEAVERVLVLMPIRCPSQLHGLERPLGEGRLHLTLHDREQLALLESLASTTDRPLPVHLEIDTGMSRSGCDPREAPALLKALVDSPGLRLAGIASHFSSADGDDDTTRRQMERFDRFLADHEPVIGPECVIHLANTYATLRHARYHNSMVRVGQAWAGYGTDWMRGDHLLSGTMTLHPSLRWTSRIIKLRRIDPGTRVGYGGLWTAPRETVLGLVPVGYADGYPTTLATTDDKPEAACIGVVDRDDDSRVLGYAQVVGAVSMDQLTIDLTDLMETHAAGSIGIGTPIELIGRVGGEPNHLPTLARAAGMIPHELLCRLHPRVRRSYHEDELSVQTIEAKPSASVEV